MRFKKTRLGLLAVLALSVAVPVMAPGIAHAGKDEPGREEVHVLPAAGRPALLRDRRPGQPGHVPRAGLGDPDGQAPDHRAGERRDAGGDRLPAEDGRAARDRLGQRRLWILLAGDSPRALKVGTGFTPG